MYSCTQCLAWLLIICFFPKFQGFHDKCRKWNFAFPFLPSNAAHHNSVWGQFSGVPHNQVYTCGWLVPGSAQKTVPMWGYVSYMWRLKKRDSMRFSWHVWSSHFNWQWTYTEVLLIGPAHHGNYSLYFQAYQVKNYATWWQRYMVANKVTSVLTHGLQQTRPNTSTKIDPFVVFGLT